MTESPCRPTTFAPCSPPTRNWAPATYSSSWSSTARDRRTRGHVRRRGGRPPGLGRADPRRLLDRVAARAAWLHGGGIGPRDPVAVYVTSSADCFLNFLALQLARRDPGADERQHAGRRRGRVHPPAAGRSACSPTRPPRQAGRRRPGARCCRVAEVGPATPPRRRRTTGTTPRTRSRSPTRRVRPGCRRRSCTRTQPVRGDPARSGSAGPGAQGPSGCCPRCRPPHTAGILTVNQALCNRSELLFLSAQAWSSTRSARCSTRSSGGSRPVCSASR